MFCGGGGGRYLADRPTLITGPVAQWTTRLTTNQKIAGSSPARIGYLFQLTVYYRQVLAQVLTGYRVPVYTKVIL
jgi:hypothetical protein